MQQTASNKIKKIGVIGTVGLPANYGGWETLVNQLTLNLNKKFEFVVYCSARSYSVKKKSHNNAELVYLPFKANGIQSIPYDIVSMFHALIYVDILLVLGVSGCIFLPLIRLLSKKKLVVNIDGIEWKRGKWSKFAKWFLKLSEKVAVKYADILVTDNQAIADYVMEKYNVKSSVVEYGGDHVSQTSLTTSQSNDEFACLQFLKQDYFFCVCRIEPENNISMILSAFIKTPQRRLIFVGNWNSSAYGIKLRERFSDAVNINLLDPIYDQGKLDILRSNAFYYIHGHSVGGTNPSLVEAMNLGLPVLAYDVSYNRVTTEGMADYFSDESELRAILVNLNDGKNNANAMHEIAKRRYTWDIIASKYNDFLSKC